MDIDQLRCFEALARLEHMTRAAAVLHISQPALSRTLRNLEQGLGVALFDRVGKNIRLNENGEILLRYTKEILGAVQSAEEELAARQADGARSVSLSVQAGSRLLPDIIRGFKALHPDIALDISQSDEGTGRHDILLYASMHPPKEPGDVVLAREEILLGLPKSNPLSTRREVRLAEVADEGFICLHRGKGLRVLTDEYCAMAGFTPRVILESDSPATVRELIGLEVGLAFIPAITWRGIDEDAGLRLVKITNPACHRYVVMRAGRPGRYTAPAVTLMQQYLVDFFAGLTV